MDAGRVVEPPGAGDRGRGVSMKRQTKKVSPAVAQAKAVEKAVVTSAAAEPNPQYLIDVNKRYGAGSVMVLGSEGVVAGVVPIPSGLPSLDAALGVGGLAEGRLVEIFGMESSGKTSLALIFLGQAQKLGRLAGFIDAEHALDPAYAKKLGVDVTRLLISQPSCGEEALEIAETMIVEGGVRFIVVDSVAALVPKAEIEGEMGDAHVGLLARLMSQAMRKLTGVASKHGATVVFLNQIRMKIGVMFGCFHYNARVTLADGGSEKIGKIVNQELPVEVLSPDPLTGVCSRAKVVGWHDNGNADGFLQFVVEGVGGNGRASFGVTRNHMLFAPAPAFFGIEEGGPMWTERRAESFSSGDLVGHKVLVQFTPLQRQLAVASVLGDGSLRAVSRHTTALRLAHGPHQVDYMRWKEELLAGCVAWSGPHRQSGGWCVDCRPSNDMTAIRQEAYRPDGSRLLSGIVLDELTLFGVAVWAMDDGSFSGCYARWGCGKFEISVKSYTNEERSILARRLGELGCGVPTVTRGGTLVWSGARTEVLMEKIAPFVPSCMDYKLHPKFRGRYVQIDDQEQEDRYMLVPVPIVDIYEKPLTRSMRRFDLTVEGNHTYLVDGVAVHNSPETTTGGNALRFFASQRLELRREAAIKDDAGQAIGSRVKVTVVKNKVAAPFRTASVDLRYAWGLDRESDVLDVAEKAGIVQRSGAWYSYGEVRLGQGREQATAYLRENPALVEELVGKLP